jgi:hypothetical protein
VLRVVVAGLGLQLEAHLIERKMKQLDPKQRTADSLGGGTTS